MTDDILRGDGASAGNPEHGDESDATDARPEQDRLPPPMFPPGSRRGVQIRRAAGASASDVGDDDFPEEAFISPDEPIVRSEESDTGGVPDDAFISPDEPIVRTHEPGPPLEEEVEVTGIGDQGYARGGVSRERSHGWEEIDVDEAARTLEEVADGLRTQGTAALLVTPEMTRFESMLRGFLAGYLMGRGD